MVRKRQQNAISLFPFLAVLVCTMGALILLLLLTTRRIRQEQLAEAAPMNAVSHSTEESFRESPFDADEFQPELMPTPVIAKSPAESRTPSVALQIPEPNPFDDLDDGIKAATAEAPDSEFDLRVRIDELKATLDQETNKLTGLQKEIAIAQDKLKQAVSTADATKRQMQELAALRRKEASATEILTARRSELTHLQSQLDRASQTTEQVEEVLRKRESALISLRKLTENAQSEQANGVKKTVLEFTNSSGTEREPVIINLSRRGIEFLPTGITVSVADLTKSRFDDNPLLSGVYVVHQHRNPTSLTARPYVLLLVRPGVGTLFNISRSILAEAGINYGYELLQEDKLVDTGVSDPTEVKLLKTAIEETRLRHIEMYEGALASQRATPSMPRTDSGVRVLANGGIAMPGEDSPGNGRFYAGGEAPPGDDFSSIAFDLKKQQEETESATQQQTTPDADRRNTEITASAIGAEENVELSDNPFAVMQSENSKATEKEFTPIDRGADSEEVNESEGGNPFGSAGTADDDPFFTEKVVRSDTTTRNNLAIDIENATRNENNSHLPLPQIIPRSEFQPDSESVVSKLTESSTVSTPTLDTSEITTEELEGVSVADLLKRNRPLSENLGIGSTQQNSAPQIAPRSPAPPMSHLAQSSTKKKLSGAFSPIPTDGDVVKAADLPDQIDPNWIQTPKKKEAEDSIVQDSQAPSGWPSSATAPAERATRTVGPAENPLVFGDLSQIETADNVSEPNPFAVQDANGTHNSVATTSAAELPAPQGATDVSVVEEDPATKVLRQFMRRAQLQKADSEPDTALLKLLNRDSAKQKAAAMTTQAQERHPVLITVEEEKLTVAGFQPINLSRLSDPQILQFTLEALATRMERVTPNENSFALPTIDFEVATGQKAKARQAALAQQLRRMDVPTRSVKLIEAAPSANSEFHRSANRFRIQTTPKVDSADPVNVPARQRNSRGLSL